MLSDPGLAADPDPDLAVIAGDPTVAPAPGLALALTLEAAPGLGPGPGPLPAPGLAQQPAGAGAAVAADPRVQRRQLSGNPEAAPRASLHLLRGQRSLLCRRMERMGQTSEDCGWSGLPKLRLASFKG